MAFLILPWAQMWHLALSLIVFYAVHSALAWTGVKRWTGERLGLVRWYRLAYSIQSVVLLGWVWLAYRQVARSLWCELSTGMIIGGILLMLVGGLLAGVAVLRFGGSAFLGLRPEVPSGLVRSGLHSRMRHPIYTGTIMVLLGWLLLAPTPATALCIAITFVYLPIGIHLEELKLLSVFGDDYRRYQREVPALWPRWHTT